MQNPDWKITLKASLVSFIIVLGLGFGYVWMVGR
jgi:hypothetical protein